MTVVIKVGGAALADKATGESFIGEVAARLAKELPKNENCIIIHGASYIGHKTAMKYKLKDLSDNQNEWASLRYKVMGITMKIIQKLVENDIPAVYISTIALVKTSNGKINYFNCKPLKDYLKAGFVPVLHSDAPIDTQKGIAVLSGDDIAISLTRSLDARMLIFGSDVEGVLDAKKKLIKKIDGKNANKITYWNVNDVSGGMKTKVDKIFGLKGRKTKVAIISLRKDGVLASTLKGDIKGTEIVPGR